MWVTGLAAVGDEAAAMDISGEGIEMDAACCEAIDFYNPGTARPTAQEVTLLALMVISHITDRRELTSWVQGVVKQLEDFRAHGKSWAPPLSLQSDDGDCEYERQLARDWSRYIKTMAMPVRAGTSTQQTCGMALLRLEPTAAVTGMALRRYFLGIRRIAGRPELWGPYADSAGKRAPHPPHICNGASGRRDPLPARRTRDGTCGSRPDRTAAQDRREEQGTAGGEGGRSERGGGRGAGDSAR
jgi:hypothetical protein